MSGYEISLMLVLAFVMMFAAVAIERIAKGIGVKKYTCGLCGKRFYEPEFAPHIMRCAQGRTLPLPEHRPHTFRYRLPFSGHEKERGQGAGKVRKIVLGRFPRNPKESH